MLHDILTPYFTYVNRAEQKNGVPTLKKRPDSVKFLFFVFFDKL